MFLKTLIYLQLEHNYFFITIIYNSNYLNRSSFEMEIFCNVINAFTVTFDQFNKSLLNNKTTTYWPQTFEQYKWMLLYLLYISVNCKVLYWRWCYIFMMY